MSENPFAPYSKPYEALRAIIRFGQALVEQPSDFLVLLFVAERTASWQKAADTVSLRQFVNGVRTKDGVAIRSGCGLQLTALKQALARLESLGLLIRERRHSERGADGPTEHRIVWKRVAELIEAIPVAVKRPPPGHVTATPVADKRPHSKESNSKDSYSLPASPPSRSSTTAETAPPVEAGRQAEILKLLTEVWPHIAGTPRPKLLREIDAALGDCPLEPFAQLLADRRKDARSFGLALNLAIDARKRWDADAAGRKRIAEAEAQAAAAHAQKQIANWRELLADPKLPEADRALLQGWLDESTDAPPEPPRDERGRCAKCNGVGTLAGGGFCTCAMGRDMEHVGRDEAKKNPAVAKPKIVNFPKRRKS